MDAQQVKELLNQRAEEVCGYLLPAGRRVRDEWVVGDASGKAGDSCKVKLEGSRAGYWHDFNAGGGRDGGDLFHVWQAARGVDFKTALAQARQWLGLAEETPIPRTTALHQSSAALTRGEHGAGHGTRELSYEPVQEGSEVWKYLTETRKISPAAIRAYRIGEALIQKEQRRCMVFPFFDAAGNLVRLKFRDIADKKYMFLSPKKDEAGEYRHGAPLVLFGIQAIDAKADGIALTEGELDALSMYDYGWPGVSLPIGAQATQTKAGAGIKKTAHDEWLENCHEWLQGFARILLALDMDEPGRLARDLLVPRLGMARCSIVDFPEGKKDANDCAQAGIELVDALAAARECDPPELRRPRDFEREIFEEFWPVDGKEDPGDETPWTLPFRFREGETTIWHGYSGGGKTIVINFVMAMIAKRTGKKTAFASLEMKPAKTFKNIMRQTLGRGKPVDEAHFREHLEWIDRFFFVFSRVGEATSTEILEVWEYAARKYGVQHFILDSMMKLSDIGFDDYESQRKLINRLGSFADAFRVHVHLVCHSRKPDQRHPEMKHFPDKHAVSGHADITNGVDNVVCVWRNREKETELQKADLLERMGQHEPASQLRDKWGGREDTLFVVQKQRETGCEPIKRLFFDGGPDGSWQFNEEGEYGARPRARAILPRAGEEEPPPPPPAGAVEVMMEGEEWKEDLLGLDAKGA